MSTRKSELSKKNIYHIEKFRFLELKNFCRQYPIWKKAYQSLTELSHRPEDLEIFHKTGVCSDPTSNCAIARMFYSDRIKMVERVAMATDESLYPYILRAVTEGISYDVLNVQMGVPCCRKVFYNLYRRFFWLLNKERG